MSVSKGMCSFFLFLLLMLSTGIAASATLSSASTVQNIPLLIAETRDENGEIASIRPENQKILDYFERTLGIHFDIKRYPLSRLVENVKAGEGLAFGLSKTSERLSEMRYSIPIFSDFIWVIVRSDSALKFNSVEDLKGKSVGIVRGIRFGDEIDSKRNRLFKVEEDQPQTSSRLKKLLSGRMDMMLFNSRTANPKELETELNNYLRDKNIRMAEQTKFSIKVLSKPFLIDDIHFTNGLQNDADIINRINAAILKGRKSGELPALWKPEHEAK